MQTNGMSTISAVRGFKDILPGETEKWQYLEQQARDILSYFNFREIRLPLLERTELFSRSIGEATDIVEKEMYSFLDRGNEYLSLRPEATASVIRAYLEHAMYSTDPVAKLFTIGPMFRRERPQKGRYRQFHQINAEVLGLDDPRIDAELIYMLIALLTRLDVATVRLEINSLGCRSCRPSFRTNLTHFLAGKQIDLCEDCQRRLASNPLRIFDCKVDKCREIVEGGPRILDFICDACRSHFASFMKYLELLGMAYDINTRMVRGLDYYVRTAFEITTGSSASQNAVAGGGRYDGLVKELGGPDIPGIGFAIGCERLIALLPRKDEEFISPPLVFLASMGDEAQRIAFLLGNRLRLRGIKTEMDYSGKGLKGQIKRADKLKCRYTLFLGERELAERAAPLRNMLHGTQEMLRVDHLEEDIIDRLCREDKNLV